MVVRSLTTEQMGVTVPKFCSVTGSSVCLWMNGW